jgi:tetratricopeptide (TPR) repeat protein
MLPGLSERPVTLQLITAVSPTQYILECSKQLAGHMPLSSDKPGAESLHAEAKPKQDSALGRFRATWIGAGLLVICTLLAYSPALHGQFVWDDDSWTTAIVHLLRDFWGLCAMWTNLTALQQYFPLSGTTFWIDYHLWGFCTLPYHIENVLLHALAALLAWKLLVRLKFPGAWLVASIFALHPVMVESVGWITERKNVLSLALYLGALSTYGRVTGFWETDFALLRDPKRTSHPGPLPLEGERENRRKFREHPRQQAHTVPSQAAEAASSDTRGSSFGGVYLFALFQFTAAMLAKTTAFSLPPVLLLLAWWKRGRLRWRKEILPTLPFFGVAIGLGWVTSWVERHHVGTGGPEWAISFPERCLIAGRALWFYLGKLLWPANLCFVYPRWQLDTHSLAQWLFPISAVLVVLALWLWRSRIGRGPLAAVLFFVGTLSPLLGFINGYFMRYSFVCDHWAYLSNLGLITLAVGLLVRAASKLATPRLLPILAMVLLPILAALTWQQSHMYRDMETLWRTTLAKNPNATMAQINLGNLLYQQGRPNKAIVHFEKALELQPSSVDAHSNLGAALLNLGRVDEAIAHLRRAVEIQPTAANAHNNLGNALLQKGQVNEALIEFQRAVELAPGVAGAHYNLGTALLQAGRVREAIAPLQAELKLQPNSAEVRASLGEALLQVGQVEAAIEPLQKAIELKPGLASAHHNLGNALFQKGLLDEADGQFRLALQLQPTLAPALIGRGNVLLRKGSLDDAEAQFQQALKIRPDLAEAHFNLAGIQLQKENTEAAATEFEKALAIQPSFAPAQNNLGTVLLSLGRVDEAISHLNQALKLRPDFAEAHNNLANAYFRMGRPKEAVAEYEAALALQTANPQLLNNLAWALATCPEDSVRNGARAVELARQANELTGDKNPRVLGTLAAALAESGNFLKAVETAQRALELATAKTNSVQIEALRTRLALYQDKRPFRDQELRAR